MNPRWKRVYLFLLLAMLGAGVVPAQAGGPLYVTGPNSVQEGKAFVWDVNPIPYYTDKGGLGNQTNAEANAIVATAFQAWMGVATADISLENAGQLDSDITAANVLSFENGLENCEDANHPPVSIVYDIDGSIITSMGGDNNSILGFASSICTDDQNGFYTRGYAVLNGRFIDGQPDTPSHSTVALSRFEQVFIHEFGHLLGLDHSQINLNCLTSVSCSAEDYAGLPIMFPVLLDGSTGSLKVDDISAISNLYPAESFAPAFGRIQGRVYFSDGVTQAQGYNVIARKVGDPRTTAVSSVSGFLFTAAVGNSFYPNPALTQSDLGSRDQTLIGYYDIPGLPPGDYTIEVEAIYNGVLNPFIGGSRVGPIGDIGFQFKLPGACNPQYLNYPSSPGDSCSAFTTVTVTAGSTVSTNTDVVFLGTAPRFDAWEDEP